MVRKNWLSMLAYGIALSFKLQAIFLAPLLFALFLRKILNWKELILIPLLFLLSLVPSWIAGRPFTDLVGVYFNQSSQYEALTINAPSIYTWVPQTNEVFNLLYVPGILLGGVVAFLLIALIYEGKAKMTPSKIVKLSLISLMLIQFFFIPIAMSAISFLSYEPYLFEQTPVPFPLLTLGLLIAICLLVRNVITDLNTAETEQIAIE